MTVEDIFDKEPRLKQMQQWLTDKGFFSYPAAIKHHGNHTGGLMEHSVSVAVCLQELTDKGVCTWVDKRSSALVVGILHDVCKLDDYIDKNSEGIVVMGTGTPISKNPSWDYNPAKMFGGHGDKSIMMLSDVINLTEEEMLCIRFHMGAYEQSDWSYYDAAIRKYESVLWTHTADMYASKVLNK